MASFHSRPEANPCRFCNRRAVGCHGTCPDYLAFARRRAEQRKADQQAAGRERDRIEYGLAFQRRVRIHRRRDR